MNDTPFTDVEWMLLLEAVDHEVTRAESTNQLRRAGALLTIRGKLKSAWRAGDSRVTVE